MDTNRSIRISLLIVIPMILLAIFAFGPSIDGEKAKVMLGAFVSLLLLFARIVMSGSRW